MDEARAARLRKRGHDGQCSLYVIVETEGNPRYLKIGISRYPSRRFCGTENPRETRLAGHVVFPTRESARLAEAYLHHRFANWLKRGEWFGAGVSDVDVMASAVLSEAAAVLANPKSLQGKEPRDFFFALIDENPVEWWLQKDAA